MPKVATVEISVTDLVQVKEMVREAIDHMEHCASINCASGDGCPPPEPPCTACEAQAWLDKWRRGKNTLADKAERDA